MDFKLSALAPKSSNWLELNLRYEGPGVAEFTSPEGNIHGVGLGSFDEYGNTSVEIRCESFSADAQYAPFGLGFLFGSAVEESEGTKTLGFGGLRNPCKKLSITTSEGTFNSTGAVYLTGLTLGGKEQKPLRFYAREGKFETGNQEAPKYFAIPLFNCLAELNNNLIGQHPLRIYPTPRVPPSLSERDKILATIKANEKNLVIAFFMEGNLCFVERLADYDDRVASLKTGGQRRITAVLVGEATNRPTSTVADFWSWFPFEVFSAFGFVSGTEIGLPWIEIRDQHGGLIRRLHGRSSLPYFWEGDPLLGRFDTAGGMGGCGSFLTTYLALPAPQRAYLEVAMDHARLGTLGIPMRLYDILDHLIRALECICREHGFSQQDLLPGLSDQTRQKVKSVISQATREIQQLQSDARTSGLLDEHRLLSTIQGRAANIGTTEKKFGLAVVSLLQSFGFPNADIIDRSLASKARTDGLKDWASILTTYRGATIHEGYMDFEKKHDVDDVAKVCVHLKDVIARLIFKETKYDGTYQSPLIREFGPQPISWVQPGTAAEKLGFA